MEEEMRLSPEDNNDSSDEETADSETELMVTSRARRATAGNRYSTLVAQEEAKEEDEEDEVAMLFAEGEGEDDDFNSDEGDEDADMSSSDDDDQGPNVGAEDLEGEQEIQKEAKEERAKKRKADMALTTMAGLKKKPKIDPTALRRAPASKPSKRKERVSWLPESDTAPGRTSLRKQTILHRAETHAKLRENEEQRLKLKARREKREREREAEAPKEMTQADRLAEAERVERRNAKSLNRWEAMEKKRAEEQAARLAALKDRKLEGAVVTWYSSSAKYVGSKDKEPEPQMPPEAKKRGRKPKALLEQLAAAKLASQEGATLSTSSDQVIPTKQSQENQTPSSNTSAVDAQSQVISTVVPDSEAGLPAPITQNLNQEAVAEQKSQKIGAKDDHNTFLTGIHEYASVKSDAKPDHIEAIKEQIGPLPKDVQLPHVESNKDVDMEMMPSPDKSSVVENRNTEKATASDTKSMNLQSDATAAPLMDTKLPNDIDGPHTLSRTASVEASSVIINAAEPDTIPPGAEPTDIVKKERETLHQSKPSADEGGVDQPNTDREPSCSTTELADLENQTAAAAASSPAEPPVEVISTRNLVILDKFDEISDRSKRDFGLFYNKKTTTTNKPVKPTQELCPITGSIAKYRDPTTGIGYANAAAYKKLHELKTHQFVWSSILGCYVGRSSLVARGVPEGFLCT